MFLRQSYKEFKRLMSFMQLRRKRYFIGLIGDSLSNASIAILMSFVIQYLLEFSVHRDQAVLMKAVWIVGGTFVMLSVLSPFFSYMYHRSVKQTMVDIRLLVFERLGRLPQSYYESHHSGDIVSRTTNDMHLMEQTFTEHLKSIIVECLTLVGSLTVMFVLDWRLALVLLVLGVLSILINTRFARPLRKISDRFQAQTGGLTERLADLLAGLQVIKMFSLHRTVTKRFHDRNGEVTASAMKQGHQTGLLEAVNFIINFMSLGGMLVVGIIMYSQNMIELGVLGQIIQLQTGVSMVFLQLGSIVSLIQHSFAGAARVFELLDERAEPDRYSSVPPQGSEQEAIPSAELEMCEVIFDYGTAAGILSGSTLSVQKGQVAALVGASGSGKSTVMKLFLGFYPPKGGTIRMLGKPLGHYKLSEIRELTAYVPQDPYLFHGTIGDNIRFGKPDATDQDLRDAAIAAYAHEFIMELTDGYDTMVGERGTSLSGGQRQRIAIARALLKNAPILLLDEATSALDAESEFWVQSALHTLMKNRTTLMIAHRLSTVEQADVIYVMEQGVVKEKGSHEQLLSREGIYAKLYRQQSHKEHETEPVTA
ncbi:ATP-binding cassette domain-containing protein [Paenibacillus sp. LMG 31458]|uniref:ATP-binding cassette domain-containing protein n=1 Tax=Paenibacillus phytorum TaxID=2654977 RepID=A0ABX1XTF0_9BACL|nr:ABC transporter ATP-binding protein [Paenibacillus phytorum]NOU71108.1 ATP-binding cassette domain-containing protein [Paenibacillus phytorum]